MKSASKITGKKRLAVWLALFALVMQTVVPLGQMLQAAQSDSVIYICTPNGIVPLHQEAPAGEIPGRQEAQEIVACQVCTTGLFGSGFVGLEITMPVPGLARQTDDTSPLLAWHGVSPTGPMPARGPPLFV